MSEAGSGAPARKLPALEPLSAFFWKSGEDGKLRIQRCADCGRYQHPPTAICPVCRTDTMGPAVVSGRGHIKTFTINAQVWLKGMTEPFVFAAIELEEQPELYVFSNVLAAPDAVRSGLPVTVRFEHQDDVWLPLFDLASDSDGENANG